jgi:divalent metal cation (Fe/Co/Zn/Cd) transporter
MENNFFANMLSNLDNLNESMKGLEDMFDGEDREKIEKAIKEKDENFAKIQKELINIKKKYKN